MEIIPNNAIAMKFSSNDITGYGVSIAALSQIQVNATGVYNIAFSAQLRNGAGASTVDIWFRKNNLTDFSNSLRTFTIPAKGSGGVPGVFPATISYDIQLSAGDYVQIMWCTPTTSVTLQYANAGTNPTRPARPSAILSVQRFK